MPGSAGVTPGRWLEMGVNKAFAGGWSLFYFACCFLRHPVSCQVMEDCLSIQHPPFGTSIERVPPTRSHDLDPPRR